MSKPTFVMLVGLPGSGKSTYRNNADFGTFVHLSTDDLIEEYARDMGWSYTFAFPERIAVATAQVKQEFRDAVKARQDIIVDQTNLGVKKRRSLLSQLPKDYKKICIYFEVSDVVLRLRQQARPGKTIPTHALHDMASRYVRPTLDEGFDLVIDGSEDVWRAAA
ncbi:polynucleotide kinase [Ruegeria phage RpAliso]|nr:polynucleotide kinase [Ruegeria phage RpAliso]